MHSLEDLNDLRMVTFITETGSLSGAAKVLGVNHATVFRRLSQLEERIGVRLFERNAGRYYPTSAGEALGQAGASMSEIAALALLRVTGQDLRPSGLVRISTTDSIAQAILGPVMARCRRQYPDIQLVMELDNRAVNLSKRDADIAIRPTTQPPDHLLGKRIGRLSFGIYAEREYLSANANLALDEHCWIALDENYNGHRTLRWLEKIIPLSRVGYRTSSFAFVHHACVSGLGLALLPCFLGESQPTLKRLGDVIPECAVDLWVLTHPDLRETTRIKVVYQLLQIELTSALTKLAKDE